MELDWGDAAPAEPAMQHQLTAEMVSAHNQSDEQSAKGLQSSIVEKALSQQEKTIEPAHGLTVTPTWTSEVTTTVLQHPSASHHIVLERQALGYLLRRRRRRTVGMHITTQGLEVNAPDWVAIGEIERILKNKARWIVRKLHEQAQANQEQRQLHPTWQNGMYLPWRGGLLQLRLTAPAQSDGLNAPISPARLRQLINQAQLVSESGEKRAAVQEITTPAEILTDSPLAACQLQLDLPANAQGEMVQQVVGAWVQQQALQIFAQRLEHYAPMLGVRWQTLKLSRARSSWGCATSKGTIRLHWRLPQLAPEVLDYVVVHELAHLREMNHSPRFWRLVEQILPDYRQHQFQLKQTVLPPW